MSQSSSFSSSGGLVSCDCLGGASANVKVSSVGIEVFLRLFDRERRNLLIEDQFLIGAKVDVDNDPLGGVAGSVGARLSRSPDLARGFDPVARRGGFRFQDLPEY